jgi:Flp pilus assembly protein TadG
MMGAPQPRTARRRTLAGLARDARGATAVEFALVLPLLVIFVFGIWWLGWAINLGGEVRHAVEMGSRVYILHPSATATELQTAVASHLTDVDISDISLATASTTVGTTTSQHITWSYQTHAPIPFMSSIPISFSGTYDVPSATN